MQKLCQLSVLSLMLLIIENSIKKKLQSKMCFARRYGTVIDFKLVCPETNLARLLLPSPAWSVVDAPLVTHLVILIQGYPSKKTSRARRLKGDFS